jgi:hypothetical protein
MFSLSSKDPLKTQTTIRFLMKGVLLEKQILFITEKQELNPSLQSRNHIY